MAVFTISEGQQSLYGYNHFELSSNDTHATAGDQAVCIARPGNVPNIGYES